MITNIPYKLLAGQIAALFCESAASKPICIASIKQRIISKFNNVTFEYFLENLEVGRYSMLKYSNWRQGSNCRDKLITVTFIDIITGNENSGTWNYQSANCEDKSYYWPDLNHLVGRYGHVMLDTPLQSGANSEIGKPRLIYSHHAVPSYGISFVPGTVPGGGGGGPGPGGGGNIIPKVPAAPVVVPEGPGKEEFDLVGLLTNPIVLIGLGVGGYLLFKK